MRKKQTPKNRINTKKWVLMAMAFGTVGASGAGISPALASGMSNRLEMRVDQLEKTITGTVTAAATGETLPGVNILIKGTGSGTVTDLDGNFTLEVPSDETVLVVSSIGYVKQEITVGSRTTLDIAMSEDLQQLGEVVVVGYGTQKKSDITGAISQVSSEELEATPIQNALQGIQGRAAGVDIASNARPGEVGSIRIRGSRSIAGGNDPLYVLDGVPLQSGGIEMLNPNDIESIEVLKDASASAIYGSRAANGVVLITTKKGKDGRAQINFDASMMVQNLRNLADYYDAAGYANYRRDAARGAGAYGTAYPNPQDDFDFFGADATAWNNIANGYDWVDRENLIPAMRPTTAAEQEMWGVSEVPAYDPSRLETTDWTDYVEQTGITQNYNLSSNWGNEKTKAFISGGYLDQTGTNVGQDYKRYNALVNLEIQAVDWLKLGGSINASYSIQNYGYSAGGSRGSRTIFEAALGQLPFAKPYDANGNYIFNPGGDPNIVNPIQDGEYVINERTTLRAFGSFFAEAKLAEGLRIKTIFGPDIRNYRNGQFQAAQSSLRGGGSASSTNYARLSQSQAFSWTWENLVYYDKTFGDHTLNATFLQSSSYWKSENSDMTASDLPYDSQLWYNLGSTNRGALDGWGSGFSQYTLMSYMARFNYSYKDRYLLTLTGRSDGASVLSEGNKWDFFPSFSLGWKIHDEAFMSDVDWVNQLKLRIGMGTVGNQAVAPYNTAGGLVQVPYVFGSDPANGYVTGNPKGSSQGALPNRNLGWEKTRQWNFGLDFGLWKDRLYGSIEYYNADTYDLLLDKTPNSVTGYSNITVNAGKTRNKGVELTLSSVNIDKSDFSWITDFTFSSNRTEIVELENGAVDDVNNQWFIGKPISVYYDYNKIGIWQQSDADLLAQYSENGSDYEPGDIRVQDVNGDNRIDPNNDRVILGQTAPKWTGGITNTFNYKNFELSAFVYARWGNLVQGGAVDMSGRYASRIIDYWTPTNPTNAYPRADYNNGGQPIHYSAMNYQDGSFVKVRFISLGYTFPQDIIGKWGMSNLKLYTQVQNPFLFSKTDFIDPDSSYQIGGSNPSASSITTRSFVFGLNMTF
ncbi:SusC/RagA family TonB-linked outer membrane protein [Echinicola vietnamensis]|uniref:TonB-linked outer membrane protein, SusC/RagA family n=1 Tax=Echinicola vietnamensis (strain DSM 17526 / LMG 23754 / KMM 6221) TaxID=926556 RepID=L0FZ25_ECHVK|nr:TonB-dependent receptor [Echinicola vietnamensis]AGA77900.1 TonB-linked outer membrane protein, SusC/RagA family [Echinicola vietnamensis DSM 17526]